MSPFLWTTHLGELALAAMVAPSTPPAAVAQTGAATPSPPIESVTPGVSDDPSVIDSLEGIAEAMRGESTALSAQDWLEGSKPDRAVRRILASHMERDAEKTLEDLRWLPGDLDALRGSLVRALGESQDVRSLDWISVQLDDPELVNDALIEIARLTRSASEEVRAELREEVRALLDDGDDLRRRLARSASVALDDEEAAPVLVGLLEGSEEPELEQIQRALEALSGMPRPQDVGGWGRWLGGELEWSAAHAGRHLANLEGVEAAKVATAIQELSARTYQRARWSRAIGDVVVDDRRSPELRRMGLLALQQLDSPASQSIFTQVVASPGTGEAHAALVALAEGLLDH